MQSMPLTKDLSIPAVGFGTYLIPNDEAAIAVGHALRAGYRHLDTAEVYGNEAGVGEAIHAFLSETGRSRNDLFVTTKLWPGNAAWGQTPKTFESTLTSLDESLTKLRLAHVDLYLIHAPFEKSQRLAQWKALVEARRLGKARAIGVSNFSQQHLEELREAGLPPPDANQIELHPWSQKPQLVAYLAKHHIAPIAYSSLVPLSTWRTAKGHHSAKTPQMRADAETSPFKVMAKKYGVTESQVLLRWAVQQGYAVLPKSTNPERIRQNLDLFGFALDAADLTAIAGMDRGDGVAWTNGDPTKNA